MKVRITGRSLRFRVSQTDLVSLQAGGRVETTIHFAPQAEASFTYALEHSHSAQGIAVRYVPGEVTVILSVAQVEAWSSHEQIGIYENVDIGRAEALDLIIEKDFACLDGSDAENADTFPNPTADVVY